MSILAESGHEGFPKAVFHLLPGLSSVPLDEAESVVSTQVKIVEIGDLVNMERPRRSIVVEDVDRSSSARLLVIAGIGLEFVTVAGCFLVGPMCAGVEPSTVDRGTSDILFVELFASLLLMLEV